MKLSSKKITEYNRMRETLIRIANGYMTPTKMRSPKVAIGSGLDYTEHLEMSYENIQQEAKNATKGTQAWKLAAPVTKP